MYPICRPTNILFFLMLMFAFFACKAHVQLDIGTDEPAPPAAEPIESPPPPTEPAGKTDAELLSEAVSGSHRTEAEKQRDQYRHPQQTLKFFGISQDMTVVEVSPGQGWYTKVLAPVVREKGKLIVVKPGNNKKEVNYYKKMLAKHNDVLGDVDFKIMGNEITFGENDSVDLIVSFRNSHFWAKAKNIESIVYQAIFDVLKPGGVFGMVHHRADDGSKFKKSLKKGYLTEKYVIKTVLEAGFELVEKSEINANPEDTKDYGRGVWSLPPALAYGEKDRDTYIAIGESDRMTLKFRKPTQEKEAPAEAEPETISDEPQDTPPAQPEEITKQPVEDTAEEIATPPAEETEPPSTPATTE